MNLWRVIASEAKQSAFVAVEYGRDCFVALRAPRNDFFNMPLMVYNQL